MAELDIKRFLCDFRQYKSDEEFNEKIRKSKVSIVTLNATLRFIAKAMSYALEKQSLRFKGGDLVEIEQKNNIKAGNWYVCDTDVVNDDMAVAFRQGSTYYCPKDGYIDACGALFELGSLGRYFHLATREEIAQSLPDLTLDATKDYSDYCERNGWKPVIDILLDGIDVDRMTDDYVLPDKITRRFWSGEYRTTILEVYRQGLEDMLNVVREINKKGIKI